MFKSYDQRSNQQPMGSALLKLVQQETEGSPLDAKDGDNLTQDTSIELPKTKARRSRSNRKGGVTPKKVTPSTMPKKFIIDEDPEKILIKMEPMPEIESQ